MGAWGVLETMALVAQLTGLHAIMLVTLAAHLLQLPQCDAECAKLEECAGKLRALLQWRRPAPAGAGRDDVAMQLGAGALAEADALVGSYRGSTLLCRIRSGRSMAARLRGMQDRVNWLYDLQLRVHVLHASLLVAYHHPVSDTNDTNHHDISAPLHGEETSNSAYDSRTSDTTGQGAADGQSGNAEKGGFESV